MLRSSSDPGLSNQHVKILFWPLNNPGLEEIKCLVQGYPAGPDKTYAKKCLYSLDPFIVSSGDKSDLYPCFFLPIQGASSWAQTPINENMNNEHSLSEWLPPHLFRESLKYYSPSCRWVEQRQFALKFHFLASASSGQRICDGSGWPHQGIEGN